MWTPWLSSPSTPRHHHRRSFTTCSSFKDIEQLLHDDDGNDQKQHRLILPHKNLFNRIRISTSIIRALSSDPNPKSLQPTTNAVVVYFTSLRVVRRTFDDCRTVRSILRSFKVPIVEYDVSMDSSFLDELNTMLIKTNEKVTTLPRVFINGRCLGGVEEVRRLHECGELKKMIGIGMRDDICCNCKVCDGHRFVVCEKCDGSHKVYVEKLGFRSCGDCNVNGLIRCPNCFSRY